MFSVCVVGLGNLGKRYVEGLAKLDLKLKVYLYDIVYDNSVIAKKILNTNKPDAEIKVFRNPPNNLKLDLVIISSNANGRAKVVADILNSNFTKSIILEKVLEQSIENIDQLQFLTRHIDCYVNTPKRLYKGFKEIKNIITSRDLGIDKITVQGFSWGIGCNAIHYFDLFCFIFESDILSVDSTRLGIWSESKRKGFLEVDGILSFELKNGIQVSLESHNNNKMRQVINFMSEGECKISVDETGGEFFCFGEKSALCARYQSEITVPLVREILLTNTCSLPTIQTSAEHHKPLIQSLLNNWNTVNRKNEVLIRIT